MSAGAAHGIQPSLDPSRQPLHFPLTRRALLRLGAPETATTPGKPTLRLTELGTLPDARLRHLAPMLLPGCSLWVADGSLWGRTRSGAAAGRILPADPAAVTLVQAIDARTNLQLIALLVAERTGAGYEDAFAEVRTAFLALVRARLVVPA